MQSHPTPRRLLRSPLAALPLALAFAVSGSHAADPTPAPQTPAAPATESRAAVVRELSLEECLAEAQRGNRNKAVSRFAVALAEAQHRQALAAYWPQITLHATVQRLDQTPNFLFPATTMGIPAQTITTPPGTAMVTLPAGMFGSPVPIQLPVSFPGQTISTPAQVFQVPAQDVQLMDPTSWVTSADLKWLLFDGGMRKGYRESAKGLVDAAKEEARRTDLEIADSVKRMYFGAILARQVHGLGRDTLARMEATLGLTETMYKEGSGKVTKADYLDNKIMVDTLRTAVAVLEKNEAMSQAALANTMGLSWRDSIKPTATEVPYAPQSAPIEDLVGTAYRFSPDWGRLEAGLRAASGAAKTARSGYSPKLALTGEVHRWWNDMESGLATSQNKEGWTVGIGVELPLWDGLLTRNRIAEATARVGKLREQQILLKEGIGLQVKDTLLGLDAARKAYDASRDAMKAASENRDLNTRAYQNELVETEKVIRAQLMEAFMSAQHYKAAYDHAELQSRLNLIVGTEVWRQFLSAR